MPEELQTTDNYIQVELQKFNVSDAAITEMRENFLTITVTDFSDKANAKLARERRLEVKGLRVAVEKTRKELKADALKFTQAIDGEARRITGLLEPIEIHLQTQEEIVTKHAEREAEKDRQRIAAEQEAARRQLEADQAKLDAERAEVERMRAEIERERAEVEAKRQHEADIAAAVELGRQRANAEQTVAVAITPEPGQPAEYDTDVERLSEFAATLRSIKPPICAHPQARKAAYQAIDALKAVADLLDEISGNLAKAEEGK